MRIIREHINNQDITDIEIAALLMIDFFNNKNDLDWMYLDLNTMLMNIYNKDNISYKIYTSFSESINRLIKTEIIKGNIIKTGIYHIKKIEYGNKYYDHINTDNYLKLIRCNKKNKYAIIRYLCILQRKQDNSINYFCKLMNKSNKTICSFNSVLKEMNIIEIKKEYKKNNVTLVV